MKQIQTIRTPSGPLAVILPSAEKLLAEGVISGTLDGDLHAADAATVKAALMASAVCDFCSTPGAAHYYDVPDFGITTHPRGGTNYSPLVGSSTGGWMACDACHELIQADKRKQLVDRATEMMAFPKFTRRAVEELYAKFWQGMDERAHAANTASLYADFIENRLPDDMPQGLAESYAKSYAHYKTRDGRIKAVAESLHLDPKQVEAMIHGELSREVVERLSAFNKHWSPASKNAQAVRKLIEDVPKKPMVDVVPHWQRALDMKFKAQTQLVAMLKATSRTQAFSQLTDLNDPQAVKTIMALAKAKTTLEDLGFTEDAKLFQAAQAYSFNAETIAAIREAARSIPHDAPLSSIETPNTGAGWFWFAEPLPVHASPVASNHTHALLWGWVNHHRNAYAFKAGTPVGVVDAVIEGNGEPAIMFSAYVLNERNLPGTFGKDVPSPSTKWYWPLSMSFTEMIAFSRGQYKAAYGPGSKFEGDESIIGEEPTIKCITELSLFFVMSCLWFKQTVPILTREPGHVERHARKRYVREHDLKEPPTVQVVALRKTARTPAEQAEGAQQEGAREYHCRWIVQGHPRLQACGPGRKDRRLIWIEAYPKGPEDKPLRVREKVFAVVR